MYDDWGNRPNMSNLKEFGLQMCKRELDDKIDEELLNCNDEIEDQLNETYCNRYMLNVVSELLTHCLLVKVKF